ncbi:MAG: C39 family peptidase [Candidatus Poribacteria bacterium]|nr:C39 family peptidase [Candidatus Poribacteria bacterium]
MRHFTKRFKTALHAALALLMLAVIPICSKAEVYPYPYGKDNEIVTLKGLPLDLTRFDPIANGYIPHKGGNDFIMMEQFDQNCGPNSVQMLLYYHRKHRRLKDIWKAGGIQTVAFGTSPSELRQALNASGVPAHWYTNRTLDDVRRYIKNNRPPIMLLRLSNTGYHWVVAVGYDTRWDEFLIADPNGHFKWWTAEQLNANWTLEWLPEFETAGEEWYEFQLDAGLFNQLHLKPNTVIVPSEAPTFETSYRPYWSDMQTIEVYGETKFRGGIREWEDTLTFQNPFSIIQVSDIELLTSTGTASVDGWTRINDRSIKLWGEIEDGWFLRGRMWVMVQTFYFNDIDTPASTNAAKAPSVLPTETSLLPNYPNPFNPETWIPYQLAKPADVSVSIYSADGKLVRNLALGHKQAGIYSDKSRAVYWDGKNRQGEPVASGIYFYTLTAGDFTATKKMLIQK